MIKEVLKTNFWSSYPLIEFPMMSNKMKHAWCSNLAALFKGHQFFILKMYHKSLKLWYIYQNHSKHKTSCACTCFTVMSPCLVPQFIKG